MLWWQSIIHPQYSSVQAGVHIRGQLSALCRKARGETIAMQVEQYYAQIQALEALLDQRFRVRRKTVYDDIIASAVRRLEAH